MLKSRLLVCAAALAFSASSAQAVTVNQTFGVGTSFDDGPGSVSFLLAGLNPDIESDLAIDFTFFGDLNAASENFELFLDGTSFGVGCDFNTGNDNFGISRFGIGDFCSQTSNSLTDASLLISATDALGLLADGALEIVFEFSAAVDAFVDIRNGGQTRSGVFFGNTRNASFAAGGTVAYEATAPVPVPPALPLLAAGLLGLAFLRQSRRG